MAARVRNQIGFKKALRAIERRPLDQRPSVLGFVLFDDRRSHRVVRDFASAQFQWLDTLAASTGMVLFFFLPGHPRLPKGTSSPQVLVAENDQPTSNPSLGVAHQFGLGPSDLPGVVFFTETNLERPGPHSGVYWPLRLELFDQGARDVENELAHIFSLVQKARARTASPAELLTVLRQSIDGERRRAQVSPLLTALRTGVLRLVTFPGRLLEAATIAFGQEAARQAVSGHPPLIW